jgi:phosphatidylglycerol:prolipoprotein diacylglycerol transferase
MHPILFRIGSFELHTYGVAMGLAFVVAIVWSVRRAHMAGVTKSFIFDLAVVVILSSLVGARLSYVGAHWDEYRHHLLDIISPFQSDGSIGIAGMVLLGGVIAAIIVGAWFLRRRKVGFWSMADVIAPPLALGIGIGRLGGCFLNGCCFGVPTDGPLGMVFPPGCYASSVYPGIPIHPTQLYAAGAALVIAVALPILERRWRRFAGWTFSLFMVLYGIDRFVVEGYRYYSPSTSFHAWGMQWTGSRILAGAMVIFGVVAFLILRGKAAAAANTETDRGQNNG